MGGTSVILPNGHYVSGGREYLTRCPECNKEKFYWNLIKNVGFCHSCHRKVSGERQFAKAFDGQMSLQPKYQGPEARGPDPELFLSAVVDKKARAYLNGRWVSEAQIIERDIRYYAQRIYVPVTPLSPEFPPGWICRRIHGEKGWRALPGLRKAHYVYGRRPEGQTVVLVEGVFDVLSPGLYGIAVALLGTHLSNTHLAWLRTHYKRVIVWLDPDVPGQAAAKGIVRQLRAAGLWARNFEAPVDPGALGPAHPGVVQFKADYNQMGELLRWEGRM